jgi:hypothetical protein
VEKELSEICASILQLLDEHLIPTASSGESKVFYLKMKVRRRRRRARRCSGGGARGRRARRRRAAPLHASATARGRGPSPRRRAREARGWSGAAAGAAGRVRGPPPRAGGAPRGALPQPMLVRRNRRPPPARCPSPRLQGDYHRYLAEFKTGADRKEAAEHTLLAYKAAQVRGAGAGAGAGAAGRGRRAGQHLGRLAGGRWEACSG